MPRNNPLDTIGLEALRAGVPRWHAAMNAGRRAAPKCDCRLRSGRRCRVISIPEARTLVPPVFRCSRHMPPAIHDRIAHLLRARGEKLAKSTNLIERKDGLSLLRQVEIREVRRRWRYDPEYEFDLIGLTFADRKRVDAWLAQRGYDLGHVVETDKPMTACRRNFVLLQVGLCLSGRLTEELALRSLRSAVGRDVKWYAGQKALLALLPPDAGVAA